MALSKRCPECKSWMLKKMFVPEGRTVAEGEIYWHCEACGFSEDESPGKTEKEQT